MAIDTYVGVTVNATSAVDGPNKGHTGKGFSASAVLGDVTIAFDHAKVATRSRLREAIAIALQQIESGGSLTA